MFGSGQSGGAQQARGLAHAPQTIHQKVLTITDGLGDSLHFDFAIEERVVGGKTVETKGIHSWGIPCTLLANKMIATKHIAILRPYQWFTYAFSAPLDRIQGPPERSALVRRQLRPTNARQASGHSPQNDAIGGDVVFIRGWWFWKRDMKKGRFWTGIVTVCRLVHTCGQRGLRTASRRFHLEPDRKSVV